MTLLVPLLLVLDTLVTCHKFDWYAYCSDATRRIRRCPAYLYLCVCLCVSVHEHVQKYIYICSHKCT